MPENRITRLLKKNKKLLIAYYMPEFPVPGATLPVLEALQKNGADLIELGIAYSDPIGDGPVIQDAAHTAIRNGMSVKKLLDLVSRARKGDGCRKITAPILLMGYCNPLIAYGGDCFLQDAANAGVDGLLLPDLPPEEADDFLERAKGFGLTVVFLVSPVTPPERIEYIDSLSTDFSYCLAVNATTGTSKLSDAGSEAAIDEYLRRVRRHTGKKFVVGFGIKDKARVEHMWELADGAVVGTALLQHIAGAVTPEETARLAGEFWQTLQ
ncbi:MAG: tryptophan synthase subunit alpha [Chlorobiaceae bacterium]|jgi:tryptophan synthase alpha chain|nr:tryptophan synthase subunit alpha [Chlorobiaceae bacterium]NTW63908.1 tryptophan synthase subunit alpha [Chlorobiaceae bacterium]